MPVDVQTFQKMATAVRERVKRVVMGQEKNLHRMLGNLVGEAVDAFVQLGRDRLNR